MMERGPLLMRMRFLLASFVFLPALASAQAYRWVDEKGGVHYGQVPPKGAAYTTVGPAAPPASAPNQDALNKSLQDAVKDEPRRQEAAAKAAEAEAQRQLRCKTALDQLAYLDATPPRRMMKTDDKGAVSRVTEEEHQARRAEIQKSADENCR